MGLLKDMSINDCTAVAETLSAKVGEETAGKAPLALLFRFAIVQLYGRFEAIADSMRDRVLAVIKRVAFKLHMIPKTMKGKEIFKRIFFGELVPLPAEVEEGMAEYFTPEPVSSDSPNLKHKVLYAVARVP